MPGSGQNLLKTSALNGFLYSEVGIQTNGAGLTILSVLARGGGDPWLQAAEWARLPRVQAVDRLARCIADMPLCQQALVEAQDTAERLVALLPPKGQISRSEPLAMPHTGRMPTLVLLMTFLCFNLAIGIALHMSLTSNAAATAPPTQEGSLFAR